MNTALKKIWLVGGSQGIGLTLTKKLLDKKHRLVVSSRSAESNTSLLKLQDQYPHQLLLLDLDVSDNQGWHTKIEKAWNAFGGLDLWIYNAGSYQPLTMDDWRYETFAEMCNVNYLGCVKLMSGLSPYFRKQGYGKWLWNISLASDFGLPYGGAYSAPKAALMNLAESLQPELASHGIELQVINHGFVKTRLTAKNDFNMLGLMEPEEATDEIIKGLSSRRFEIRFPFNLAFILATIKKLPKSWALRITKKALKND